MPYCILKKAQHHILENIPLVFVVLLLLLGFIMFQTELKSKDIMAEQDKMANLRTAELAHTFFSLQSLACTLGTYKEDICIDYFKLTPLDTEDYFDLFGYSKITIKYKPLTGEVQEKVIYDNNKPEIKRKQIFFSPLTVYNSDLKENYFGIVEIEVYS